MGRVTLLVVISLVISGAASLTEREYIENLKASNDRLHFKIWQAEQGKTYKSFAEQKYKLQVFLENLKVIRQLNDEHRGQAIFKPNKYADMNPEEFRSTLLMPRRPPPQHPLNKYRKVLPSNEALPDTFDWRDSDMVTPVKDQGSCGTCWAFSTVANVEGQFAMKHGKLLNLSVEQVMDCDDSKDFSKGYADCGVYGGWPYLAFGYLQRQGGIETWEDYDYCCSGKNPCFTCPPGVWNSTLCGPPMPYCNMSQSCGAKLDRKKFVSGLNVTGWEALPQNETYIADQLTKIGPLSVAMDARMLQFYSKGVFDPLLCSKTSLDHAVLLVGFGTDSGIFGKTPYWLVKNSWGADWGEKGYFRIKRNIGACGINTQVTTATLA